MPEPQHSAGELLIKLSIELTELIESYKSTPTPDILERIKLKEQLLNELREFFKSISGDRRD